MLRCGSRNDSKNWAVTYGWRCGSGRGSGIHAGGRAHACGRHRRQQRHLRVGRCGADSAAAVWPTRPTRDAVGAHARVTESAAGASDFRTLDLPIVSGRGFNERDTLHSVPVCLVNEAFVRRHFEGRHPIGAHLSLTAPPKRSDTDTRDRRRGAGYRFRATMVGTFAALALVLAMVGVFGCSPTPFSNGSARLACEWLSAPPARA